MKTNLLELCTNIISVCSEIHSKHINAFCGKNVKLLNVNPVGTWSNHWALMGNIVDCSGDKPWELLLLCVQSGSYESLMSPGDRMAGSVPGLLDSLSCGSTADISITDRDPSIPQIAQACFRHLENFGLRTLGIFRVSSSKKRVRQVGTSNWLYWLMSTEFRVLRSGFSPWTVTWDLQ